MNSKTHSATRCKPTPPNSYPSGPVPTTRAAPRVPAQAPDAVGRRRRSSAVALVGGTLGFIETRSPGAHPVHGSTDGSRPTGRRPAARRRSYF